MELGNLWLIPVSLMFNYGLYWLLKEILVKWYCRHFLSKSAILECDLRDEKSSHSNGVVPNGNSHTSKPKPDEKKLVTDGDVASVAMETVGSVIAGITAIVSAIVMIETRHDTLYARSSILIPWCHVAAWYFIVDLYNMYDAFSSKRDLSHLSLVGRIRKYVRVKWPYVTHHVVLFSLGYPFVVQSGLRSYKGDFYVASFIGEDFSNPLVNTAKVLKLLGQEKTTFYMINGILLVVVFFTVRILNVPFDLMVYAAQYHNWDFMAALGRLKLICYISIVLQYILQIYWFILIIKLALKSLNKLGPHPEEKAKEE